MLISKRVRKLAKRLFHKYIRMSDEEIEKYDDAFGQRQVKLSKKGNQLLNSEDFDTRLRGYTIWLCHFERNMALDAAKHMLVAYDMGKDIWIEWKKVWSEFKEECRK